MIDNKNLTFGQRLRKVRMDMGLNQAEFAKKLGFSANTIISRFEKNKSLPTIKTLLILAQNPDVDLHWLITGDYQEVLQGRNTDFRDLIFEISPNLCKYAERIIDAHKDC